MQKVVKISTVFAAILLVLAFLFFVLDLRPYIFRDQNDYTNTLVTPIASTSGTFDPIATPSALITATKSAVKK